MGCTRRRLALSDYLIHPLPSSTSSSCRCRHRYRRRRRRRGRRTGQTHVSWPCHGSCLGRDGSSWCSAIIPPCTARYDQARPRRSKSTPDGQCGQIGPRDACIPQAPQATRTLSAAARIRGGVGALRWFITWGVFGLRLEWLGSGLPARLRGWRHRRRRRSRCRWFWNSRCFGRRRCDRRWNRGRGWNRGWNDRGCD